MKAVVQPALVQPAAVKTEGRDDQLQLIKTAREQVEAAQALGVGVLEALAAGDSSPAHCSKVGRQDAAARQDGAARHAAYVLAAFDAGLEPLCAALDPCRDPVPPCRRPPKRRHAEGPGAVRGPGLQSRSGSQAAALEAVAARVAATTGLSVVLSRGSGGSGGSGKTPASSAPCAAAEATELHMAVPSVLTAAVALAGAGQLAAQRVVVFGADEAPPSGAKDAWATSEDAVFRRLSDVATRALAHFTARAERATAASGAAREDAAGGAGAVALEDLLLWLSSYRDLFTRPCAATGRLLGVDPAQQLLLPPVVRPFQHVPHSRLLAAARGSDTLPAYHLRTAPAGAI